LRIYIALKQPLDYGCKRPITSDQIGKLTDSNQPGTEVFPYDSLVALQIVGLCSADVDELKFVARMAAKCRWLLQKLPRLPCLSFQKPEVRDLLFTRPNRDCRRSTLFALDSLSAAGVVHQRPQIASISAHPSATSTIMLPYP
jgi:hypothetical protein